MVLHYTYPDRPQLVDSKDGEMSEWLKERAWKLIPAALSNAHRHAPTRPPSTAFRNRDMYRSVPVNHGVLSARVY